MSRRTKGERAKPIDDRATVTDTICEVMHDHYRSHSIDSLLCRPHDAIEMAERVLRKLGKKNSPDAVAEICRAALSSRKRGDLKRDRY